MNEDWDLPATVGPTRAAFECGCELVLCVARRITAEGRFELNHSLVVVPCGERHEEAVSEFLVEGERDADEVAEALEPLLGARRL